MLVLYVLFFFNDTATTEIYTLSLHDALPICRGADLVAVDARPAVAGGTGRGVDDDVDVPGEDLLDHVTGRSEEHTSELQSRQYLVCRLLLEKKKQEHRTPRAPIPRFPLDFYP